MSKLKDRLADAMMFAKSCPFFFYYGNTKKAAICCLSLDRL